MAGLVPGLTCLLLTPALMYVLYPPEVKDTPDAPAKVSGQRAGLATAAC
jgi:di/tricarboxylate transporter